MLMKNYQKLQYYLEIGEKMSIMSIMKLVHQTLLTFNDRQCAPLSLLPA